MDCPGCGGTNRDGARFCIGCGAALALRCVSCGNELPPAARFCDGCGSAVTSEPAAEPVAAARKVVTVVFADMTGSTALEEGMDAEAVRTLLDRIYAGLRKDVEDHGGRVVKFTGDGLMAAFGVPEVGEDDADRAVAAATTMRETMAAIASETGQPIALKAGINTGEVVVIEEDDDVVGDAVNVASRLEGAAVSGEILVGEATWRLTRASSSYEAIEPLVVKGKSEPVPAYRLVAVAEGGEETLTPPFVGRADELARLLEVFEEAVEAKAARLVTIVGSPGLGKTRLAHELAARLADRAVVREARCDPAGSATFAPIAETIRASASISEAATEEEILEALKAMLPDDDPDRDRIAGFVGAVLGVGKPGSTEQTFWALRKLIETRAAADLPRVLILDDLHWAEPLLLDFVEHIAEWIRAAPVLLVGTGRPELRDMRPSLAEGGRAAAVIALEGLDPGATEELAMGLLGTEHVPTELIARIPASTEGNPLFVRELVRMLVDDGVLRREGDAWRLTVDVEAVEVPPTIQSLLAARMDRLEVDERTVLELASVVGKEFYRGAVAELATTGVREGLEGCLERLRRKELVEPVGTYWIDEPVYRFHHALIRDAAYRRLLKETRAELHERVASWLEGKTSGLVGEHEEAIGYHLEQAHEYKRQLGREDYELGSRAAGLLRTAAERALDRDDLPGAAALAGRALERLPDFEADARSELLLMRCEALLSMGDVTHAGPAVEDFLELALEPRLSAWGTCFQGHLANLTSGGLEETEASVAEAAEQLTELGDMAGAAKAHTVRATALAGLGRFGECEAVLDEALTAARQAEGRRRSVTATLGTAPQAQVWGPNPVSRAGGRCLDLVRLLRITTGSLAVEQTSMRCQAVLEAMRGRADAARGMLRRARNKLTELGLEHELLETEQYAGLVELVVGDAEAAREHLSIAHEGFRRLGSRVLGAQTAALLARAHIQLGGDAQAEALVEMAAQLASQDVKTAIAWRSVKAEILVRRGELDEARALAEEAVRLGEPTDALLDHGMAYRQLARVLRVAGDAAGAQRADERASALFERKGATALLEEEPRPAATEVDRGAASEEVAATPAAGLDNAAVRASLTFVDTVFAKRDLAAFEALLAEDFAIDDRRRALVAASSTGREAAVEEAKSVLGIGTTRMERTPIATRGERLCLLRDLTLGKDVGSEAFGVEFLSIVELDENGLLTRWTRFEPDDLRAAVQELDDRFVAGEGEPHADAMALARAVLRAQNDRDWDAYRSTFADDLVQIDHRPVSLGDTVTGADEHVRSIQQLTELIPGLFFWISAIHRLERGRSLVRFGMRGATEDGGEVDLSLLNVYVFGDKISRMENFPVDQLDAALARFEQLGESAPPVGDTPENDAVRAALLMYEAFERQDWDAFGALHRPDGTTEDRRPGLGSRGSGRDHMVEIGRTTKSVGPRTAQWSTIAVRGSRLAVGRVAFRAGPDDFVVDVLQLFETDDEGLIRHWATWEPDDIDAALAELDARFLAGEGAPYADVVRLTLQTSRATAERDWDAYRAAFADDLIFVDHRPVSLGEIHGADGLVEAIRVMYDLVEESRSILVAVHALSDRGGVAESVTRGVSEAGGEFELATLVVGLVEDGRFVRLEFFPPEQRHAALARFEELTAAGDGQLGNACVRVVRRGLELLGERDWDRAAGIYREDVVAEDRRHLSPLTATGRAEVLEHVKGIADVVDLFTVTPIATRGERLALVRMDLREDHGRGVTFPMSWIQVDEIDEDGRLQAFVTFEVEDLDAAFAELDERFIAGEGAPFADVVETNATVFALWNARDFQAATTHIDPDFVLVDHRPLGFGTVEGVEPFMEVANSLAEVAPDARRHLARYHALADGVALVEQVSRATPEPDTDEIVYQFVLCVENGRWKRGEIFPEDELDAALARFEELSAPVPSAPPENECLRKTRLSFERIAARDWDGLTALYCEDVLVDDRRHLSPFAPTNRAELVEFVKRFVAEVVDLYAITPIAMRGERLALVRFDVQEDQARGVLFGTSYFHLVELHEDGLFRAIITFEPEDLDAAMHELDRRFAAGEGAPFADVVETNATVFALWNARDFQAATTHIDPDFVLVDHRPLGFGTVEGVEPFMEVANSLAEVAPRARRYFSRYHALADGVALVEQVSRASPDPDSDEIVYQFVVCVENGRLKRGEMFPEHDLDAALARFEELAGAGGRGALPENAATRLMARQLDALKRRHWDALRSLYADDLVREDARSGLRDRLVGAERYVEEMRAFMDLGFDPEHEILATRGDRSCLVRFTGVTPEGNEVQGLSVVEVGDDGRMTGGIRLDPDDLDAAMAELDERFIAGEGATHAEGLDAVARYARAVNARDWVGARACMTADGMVSDHRLVSFGEITADQYVASLEALADLVSDFRVGATSYLGIRDDAIWARLHIWTSPSETRVPHSITYIVIQLRDGKLAGVDAFALEDVDAARACFEGTQGVPRLRNAATELLRRANHAFNSGDSELFGSLLAEDAVHEDRRKGIGHVLTGRDKLVENFEAIHELGSATRSFTPIAIRGDRLVLSLTRYADTEGTNEVEMLRINYLDDRGRFGGSIDFDPDDVDAAFVELDERYLAGEGAPYAWVWRSFLDGMAFLNARDCQALEAGFSEDVRFVDHRPVGLGSLDDRTRLAEMPRRLAEVMPDVRWMTTEVIRLDAGGGLARNLVSGTIGGGGPNDIANLVLFRLRDGKRVLQELFNEAQLELALTRYEELRGEGGASGFDNLAVRAAHRMRDRGLSGDWDAARDLFAEDAVCEDRRVGLSYTLVGADAQVEQMKVISGMGATRIDPEAIAIRGCHLALIRWQLAGDDTFSVETLMVVDVDPDGRFKSQVIFDPDADLDAAFAELDERYFSGEGRLQAEAWPPYAAIGDGLNARDWAGLRAGFADDCEFVDHRPASLGHISTPEEQLEATRTLVELVPDARWTNTNILHLEERIALMRVVMTGTNEDGGSVEIVFLSVVQVNDGLRTRMELFAEDQLEIARARLDELRRSDPLPSSLENSATRFVGRLKGTFDRRDVQAFIGLHTEDFCHDDRRAGLHHVTHGTDEIVEYVRNQWELGGSTFANEVIAIRGDLLVLSRRVYVDAERLYEIEQLIVDEVRPDGRVAHATVFDPDDLDAAFAELDERYVSGEAAPFADAVMATSEYVAAWNARDWERLAATCASDIVIVDHRTMGWGSTEGVRGADALIEATRTLAEVAPDLRRSLSRFHALGEGIVAGEFSVIGEAPHGGEVELSLHAVALHEARRFTRFELFDGDDLGSALARYEELRAERRPTGPAENDAYREMVRSVAAQVRGDWEVVAASITDDITFEDRRRGLSWVMEGKEEVMAHLRAAFSVDGMTSQESLIATRGERLCLGRQLVTVDDYEVELLVLGEIGEDGVTCWCIFFDPGDLDAAFAELDERFLSGEGAPHADVLRHHARQRAAVVAGDWAAWRELIDEDVVLADHRPTSLGEVRGVEDVLEASRTLAGLIRDARPRVVAYHDLAADRTLIEVLFSGTADHGGEVELSYLRLQQFRDGRVVRIELFPLEDLDAARTRFTELRTSV